MSRREYDGPPLDGTYQHISERPYDDPDGETVAATDDPDGEVTTEAVPELVDGPDEPGQSTLDDWGWSV